MMVARTGDQASPKRPRPPGLICVLVADDQPPGGGAVAAKKILTVSPQAPDREGLGAAIRMYANESRNHSRTKFDGEDTLPSQPDGTRGSSCTGSLTRP